MPVSPLQLGHDEERRLAATLFNHVWDLMEKPDRSAADDDEMLHGAHASRYHWGGGGEPVHWGPPHPHSARTGTRSSRSSSGLTCDFYGLLGSGTAG
jgi:hypothetical protein